MATVSPALIRHRTLPLTKSSPRARVYLGQVVLLCFRLDSPAARALQKAHEPGYTVTGMPIHDCSLPVSLGAALDVVRSTGRLRQYHGGGRGNHGCQRKVRNGQTNSNPVTKWKCERALSLNAISYVWTRTQRELMKDTTMTLAIPRKNRLSGVLFS